MCSNSGEDKKFKNVTTDKKVSISELAQDSTYTVFYNWADWCGPCVSSMKGRLAQTKHITDSLGIPIKYVTVLYSPAVSTRDKELMRNTSEVGIENYHRTALNALTQKLGISSDYKNCEGFEKEFAVPRILLVNKELEVLDNGFPLCYNKPNFIQEMNRMFR